MSDSKGLEALGQACKDWRANDNFEQVMALASHKRLNCMPVLLSILVPWFAFLFAFGIVSFYTHYAMPVTTICFFGMGFAASIYCVMQARAAFTRRRDWFYIGYIGVTCSIAMVLGGVYGDVTFWSWMRPVYDLRHMATYNNIDPSSSTLWSGQILPTSGRRFQDAGTVYFKTEAVLDKSKAMSFKMGALYCIAPIVNPKCERNCGYDFWAVGVNCCAEDASDFRCGEYGNQHAKAGLRLMDESQRPYFRLAVLEAEGAHKIVSKHPVFYHWLQDPIKEIDVWAKQGYSKFIVAMFVSFVANGALLIFAFRFFKVGGSMHMP